MLRPYAAADFRGAVCRLLLLPRCFRQPYAPRYCYDNAPLLCHSRPFAACAFSRFIFAFFLPLLQLCFFSSISRGKRRIACPLLPVIFRLQHAGSSCRRRMCAFVVGRDMSSSSRALSRRAASQLFCREVILSAVRVCAARANRFPPACRDKAIFVLYSSYFRGFSVKEISPPCAASVRVPSDILTFHA